VAGCRRPLDSLHTTHRRFSSDTVSLAGVNLELPMRHRRLLRHLVDYAGDAIDFRIFADKDVAVFDQDAELGIRRSWASRWNPGLEELDEALGLADQEVVHFQFNFTFFDLDHMAALIEKHLPHRGIVVTFHRTSDPIIYGKQVSISDISERSQD